MSSRIQSGQPEASLTGSSSSSAASANAKAGSARCTDQFSDAHSALNALNAAQAANISALPGQLSADLPIRQDLVDALRAQIDAGSYNVNPQTLANAMLQNFFGAEEELVRDTAPCPIDRIRPSECIARGRCRCDRRHDSSVKRRLAG